MNLKESKETDPPVRRIIYLDQPFFPFNPEESLVKRKKDYPVDIITSNIDLVLNPVLKFPIDIQLASGADSRISIITPFDPELGYIVDSEDFEIKTRKAKVERITKEWLMKGEEELNFAKAPLRLSVETERSFTLKGKFPIPLSKETIDLLGKIRLNVQFGAKGSFEARAWRHVLSSGALWFKEFYPQDALPLPEENARFSELNEGFNLYLPNDPEKLENIRMLFALAPEEVQEIEINSG